LNLSILYDYNDDKIVANNNPVSVFSYERSTRVAGIITEPIVPNVGQLTKDIVL